MGEHSELAARRRISHLLSPRPHNDRENKTTRGQAPGYGRMERSRAPARQNSARSPTTLTRRHGDHSKRVLNLNKHTSSRQAHVKRPSPFDLTPSTFRPVTKSVRRQTSCASFTAEEAGSDRVRYVIPPRHLRGFLGDDPGSRMPHYPWIYTTPITVAP
jgi:hypothetical protein